MGRRNALNSVIGRLLLVEDDPHDVELVRMALEPSNLNYSMDVVFDGEQALQYLFGTGDFRVEQPLPQLVLLDLKLPKVNGIQVLQAIRTNPRTRRLVVVVMTSSQEDSDLNTCYDLGINSYIVKPLDFQQFLEVSQTVGSYWMTLNKPPLAVS
ncbi:MAG: response regulator [Oscillatoriales cyanobacterium C42_A2020_001]|nr:response regulator [Leptolyngbyaceae cyanobacterium C42_A2020_001]